MLHNRLLLQVVLMLRHGPFDTHWSPIDWLVNKYPGDRQACRRVGFCLGSPFSRYPGAALFFIPWALFLGTYHIYIAPANNIVRHCQFRCQNLYKVDCFAGADKQSSQDSIGGNTNINGCVEFQNITESKGIFVLIILVFSIKPFFGLYMM